MNEDVNLTIGISRKCTKNKKPQVSADWETCLSNRSIGKKN
jgi:hypothetical protein